MGISSRIKEFVSDQKNKRNVYNESKYNSDTRELAKLKAENTFNKQRINAQAEFKAELKAEKQTKFNNSNAGRFLSRVKEIQKNSVEKQKKYNKSNNNNSRSLGGGFGSSVNPAFGLGKEEVKVKEKRKTIIIRL